MGWTVFGEGLGLGASLIIAIGAQNVFVLKQGLLKRHVFLTALLCALIDLVLITGGVLGLGTLVSALPILLQVIAFGGAAFLAWHGIKAVKSVVKPQVLNDQALASQGPGPDRKKTVLTLLGLSLLNPHVYLDTVLLLGGIGGRHPGAERPFFILGAATASVLWFFSLAFGASLLAPLFKRPLTWRLLDAFIALVMFFIAFQLVLWGVQIH